MSGTETQPDTHASQLPTSTAANSFVLKIALWLITAAYFIYLFWSALFGPNDFILRDVGRYFLNTFRVVQEEWLSGRIPLWTPYDNYGFPLLANPCAAALYPPKLLFFLPCTIEVNLKIYVFFHYLLTLVAIWKLARYLKLSVLASFVSMCSFVFSSPILMGYCNIPYLCSTAWLPLALYYGLKLITAPQIKDAVILGVLLTLMLLCGDPQAAYHSGILLGLAAIFCHGIHLKDVISGGILKQPIVRSYTWLLVGAALAGGLGAAQLLPTSECNNLSIRNAAISPDSLWSIPKFLSEKQKYHPEVNWYDTFVGNPAKPAEHYLQIYSFSYSPMRAIEWLVPGIFGNRLLTNDRWSCRWGLEEKDVWYPSVNCGILVYLLVFVTLTGKKSDSLDNNMIHWLWWVTVLSFIASLGRFGIYGCWFNFSHWIGFIPPDSELFAGGEIGGLYWLLTIFLPGYSGFRFPGKWLIITFLGISLLAGFGVQKLIQEQGNYRTIRRFCLCAPLIVILAYLLTGGYVPLINLFQTGPQVLSLLPRELHQLNWACGVSLLFYATGYAIFRGLAHLKTDSTARFSRNQRVHVLVILATVEMIIVNRDLVLMSPRDYWKQPKNLAGDIINQHQLANHPGKPQHSPPVRFCRPDYYALAPLQNKAVEQRLSSMSPLDLDNLHESNILIAERDSLSACAYMEEHMSNAKIYITIDHHHYMSQFDILPFPDGEAFFHPRRAYDLWGTQYFIVSDKPFINNPARTFIGLQRSWGSDYRTGFLPTGNPLPEISGDKRLYEDMHILENNSEFPLSRIVHHFETIPVIDQHDTESRTQLYIRLFLGLQEGFDHHRSAIIETAQTGLELPSPVTSKTSLPAHEHANILYYDPQRITLDVHLEQPGLLILAELYYPGWVCKVKKVERPDELPLNEDYNIANIEKVNHVMRGVIMREPGRYQVEFSYQPRSFYLGCVISLITLLACLVVLCRRTPTRKAA